MLNNFILSVSSVAPTIILLALGMFLKKAKFINKAFLTDANKLVFYLGIPALLFTNIYNTNIHDIFDLKFTIFIISSTTLWFFIVWIFSYFILRKNFYSVIGSFVQGSFRSNVPILALPILINILGTEDAAKGTLGIAFLIPLYSIMSIVLLSLHNENNKNISIKKMILEILKNPLLIAIIIGSIFSITNTTLPFILITPITMIAGFSTPTALICLGGGIVFSKFSDGFKYVVYSSILKLIIMPIFVGVLAYIFGFNGTDFVIIIIMAALPTSVSSYVMAVELGGDTYIASTNIVITTVLSGITLTFWIFFLINMGFL
ncbi:MAG: AEC family transporter [Defluviitaleaceae bacterium]|nr:AEC family transporter [Defluviitaleaceae bacterium]